MALKYKSNRPPEVELDVFHEGQTRAYLDRPPGKHQVLRCGRRWGKTKYFTIIAADAAMNKEIVGWFTPDYRTLAESYQEIIDTLSPIIASANRNDGVIELITGGKIDFWTLENEKAGRGRKYHKAIVDEAAFAKPLLAHQWRTAIEPTLLDYGGIAYIGSTPNGNNPENWFYQICNDREQGFHEYYAPSTDNPNMPIRLGWETDEQYKERRDEAFAKIKAERHPLVYDQEFRALFVDWSGVAFFDIEKLFFMGKPVDYPRVTQSIFATVDTAVKEGREHDTSAVAYWSWNPVARGFPLVLLDWEIRQMEGATLKTWLPAIKMRMDELAVECNATHGASMGVFIEDKQSGSVLLQEARQQGMHYVKGIDGKLTQLGKDARCMLASTPVYNDKVKISRHAYEKEMTVKGFKRNHFTAQVLGYRPGAERDPKMNDDALDTFCYGVVVTLCKLDQKILR